jgi:hypothetical protein
MLVSLSHPKEDLFRMPSIDRAVRSLGPRGYYASSYSPLVDGVHPIVPCMWWARRLSREITPQIQAGLQLVLPGLTGHANEIQVVEEREPHRFLNLAARP